VELAVAAEPEAWRALGFAVGPDGGAQIGAVMVRLLGAGAGEGITGWALQPPVGEIDGLPVAEPVGAGSTAGDHPNGAVSLDHVVVLTPDWDRTVAALRTVGIELSRVREVPPRGDAATFRQGFVRLGEPILELVEQSGGDPSAPARFWGLVAIVADLDAAVGVAGDALSAPRDAVQPGRRIAPVRSQAGAGVALALMTPEA
jgi:hypothetical protein